jgi:hypothetical protein
MNRVMTTIKYHVYYSVHGGTSSEKRAFFPKTVFVGKIPLRYLVLKSLDFLNQVISVCSMLLQVNLEYTYPISH